MSELEEGTEYIVEISDCCVNGHFQSKLLKVFLTDDGDLDAALFENGVLLTYIGGAVSFKKFEGTDGRGQA